MVKSLVAVLALTLSLGSFAAADPHFAQPPAGTVQPAEGLMPPIVDRVAVRAALAAARDRNLAAFRAYQDAGVYPSNTYAEGRLNVWRDRAGHYCAAATMIRASGAEALVQQVAENTNYIQLASVKQGPLMSWILTSGFTQAEIAAIQEPFERVSEDDRRIEEARLRERYRVVTAQLESAKNASLDAATDRLVKDAPILAEQLVARRPPAASPAAK